MAISRFRSVRGIEKVLTTALSDKHTDVQGFAAIALGMYNCSTSSRIIREKINSRRNSPLSYAGFMALGLLHDRSNYGMLQMEFDFAATPLEYETLAFALAKSSGRQGWFTTLNFLESKGVYVTEYAVKTLGMTEDLNEADRKTIITRLKLFEEKGKKRRVNDDAIARFFAAVVRHSMGDHGAIEEIVETMRENNFYLESNREVSWLPIMDNLTERFPKYYTIAPFFWSDTD